MHSACFLRLCALAAALRYFTSERRSGFMRRLAPDAAIWSIRSGTRLSVLARTHCEDDPRHCPGGLRGQNPPISEVVQSGCKDILLLKELVRIGTPTGAIALKLGRTRAAISIKASRLGVKLGETSPAEPIEAELNMLENLRVRVLECDSRQLQVR